MSRIATIAIASLIPFLNLTPAWCSQDTPSAPAPLLRSVLVSAGVGDTALYLSDDAQGFPNIDALVGLTDGFAIGPEGSSARSIYGNYWSAGLKGLYFLNGRRFTRGLFVGAFAEFGKSTSDHVTGKYQANTFSHLGTFVGYGWDAKISRRLRFNAMAGAGPGYAKNSNCGGDRRCGIEGEDASPAIYGDGIVPEITLRVGLSY